MRFRRLGWAGFVGAAVLGVACSARDLDQYDSAGGAGQGTGGLSSGGSSAGGSSGAGGAGSATGGGGTSGGGGTTTGGGGATGGGGTPGGGGTTTTGGGGATGGGGTPGGGGATTGGGGTTTGGGGTTTGGGGTTTGGGGTTTGGGGTTTGGGGTGGSTTGGGGTGGSPCNPPCGGTQPYCSSQKTCEECLLDAHCPVSNKFCVDYKCEQCKSSADCQNGYGCHPAQNNCLKQCTSDTACAGTSKPKCQLTLGLCVECLDNTQCTAPNVCKLPDNKCD